MLASSFFLQSCFVFYVFFVFLKMFLVGLATVVRLCFTSDTGLLIDWLYCADLFSCIAASVFNKLTYLLTYLLAILWTHISQSSVATPLKCGGVLVHEFVTNLLLSLTVKKIWKSVNNLVKLWARVRCLVFWLTVYMHFRRKFRHRRSIRRPRFPISVLNFGDLVTFYVDFVHLIFGMSAIFLLPVCFTYWPRKYTTRVDPDVNNSHQVSNWYDHTLPSYSVFVCWYVTWLCDLDFWQFDLEQLLCMAGHVTNLASKFKDPVPVSSWFMSHNVCFGYHWECVRGHCACAESRDPWVGGIGL